MIEIPPSIDIFIRRLAGVQPSPESIWLIGSRANGGATNKSDWDFVVFGDAAYFLIDASMFRNPVAARLRAT
jgi:predicted nucleotidyltransferase